MQQLETLGRVGIAGIQKTISEMPSSIAMRLKEATQESAILLTSVKSACVGSAKDFLHATVDGQNRTGLELQLQSISCFASCSPDIRLAVLNSVWEEAIRVQADSKVMLRAAEILAVLDKDQGISMAWADKLDTGKLGNDKLQGVQTVTKLAKTTLDYGLLDSSQETELVKATGEHLSLSLETAKEIPYAYGEAILGFVRAASDKKLINDTGLTTERALGLITKVRGDVPNLSRQCLSTLSNLNKEETRADAKKAMQENPEIEEQTLNVLKTTFKHHSTFGGISTADYKDLANVLQLLPEGKTETAQAVLAGMIGITDKTLYTIREKELPPQIKEFLDASLSYLGTIIKPDGVVDGSIIKAYFDLLPKLSTYRGYPIADYFRENIKPGVEEYLSKAKQDILLSAVPDLMTAEKVADGTLFVAFEFLSSNKPEILWNKRESWEKPLWYLFLADSTKGQKIITTMMNLCEGERRLDLVNELAENYPDLALRVFTEKDYLTDKQITELSGDLALIAAYSPLAIISRAKRLAQMPVVDKDLVENAAKNLYAKIQKREYLEREEFVAIRELTSELFHKIGVQILANPKISMDSKKQLILENQQLLPGCQTEELERILDNGIKSTEKFLVVEKIYVARLRSERNFPRMVNALHSGILKDLDNILLSGFLEGTAADLKPIREEVSEVINRWCEMRIPLPKNMVGEEQINIANQLLEFPFTSKQNKTRLNRWLKKVSPQKKK